MKVARIENVRAKTRFKAIKKVLKELTAKYDSSVSAVKSLENTCRNQTMEYRKAQTKHEEELHTIEHLRNELVKSHLKPKKPKFIKDVEVVEPEPKPEPKPKKKKPTPLPVRQAHKAIRSN